MANFTFTEEQVINRYKEYLAAFNSKNLDKVKLFLDEKLYFYRGIGIKPFLGRDQMLDFYVNEAWTHFNETVTLKDFRLLELATDAVALSELCYFIATIEVHLEVLNDWVDSPFGHPYRKGDDVRVTNVLMYAMDSNGVIQSIQ